MKPGLTRPTIVEAALRLLDETGLDSLTVRRLAAELGVQSPALYWHLRTKQDLYDEMADAIVLAAGLGPPRKGEPWQAWLARRARGYRRSLLDHRDGARIVTSASRLAPETIRAFDADLTAMVGRGFTPVLALRTLTAVTQYVNGFVLQEQSAPPRRPDLLGADPPTTLLAALRDSGPNAAEDAFEHGLRALVDGTAAALRRS